MRSTTSRFTQWPNSHAQRLKLLQNTYQDETCFIIGCGSSLSHVPVDVLRRRLRNELVIAMKQAYLPLADLVDFHCISRYKYFPYSYSTDSRPLVLSFTQSNRPFDSSNVDICMPLYHGGDFNKSITATGEFDYWALSHSFSRCCGPGMLYELGIYLAVHLGVRDIVTIGVDFDRGPHFYRNDPQILRDTRLERKELHGKVEEWEWMVRGIVPWRNWLASQGISWRYAAASAASPLREHLDQYDLWKQPETPYLLPGAT